jgi:hypothetical protein
LSLSTEQSRRATEKEFEQQLRAKMKRWQEEAEDSVRRQLDRAAKIDKSRDTRTAGGEWDGD